MNNLSQYIIEKLRINKNTEELPLHGSADFFDYIKEIGGRVELFLEDSNKCYIISLKDIDAVDNKTGHHIPSFAISVQNNSFDAFFYEDSTHVNFTVDEEYDEQVDVSEFKDSKPPLKNGFRRFSFTRRNADFILNTLKRIKNE